MQTKIKEYAQELKKNGIVVMEDYLEKDSCEDLYTKISQGIEKGNLDVIEKDESYSYNEFVNWGAPVANKRPDPDEGMIDVFHTDMMVPEIKLFKEDEKISEIINAASSTQYSPDNVNVYWNRSVTTTRDFHTDTYSGKFKSFVYLTDVPDRSFGPFSYVKGSHKLSKVKKISSSIINKIKNKKSTDAVFYDEENVVYCTAPKGTLIIANQAGYHRGYPQQDGRERMLLTTSYTPDSTNS